MAPLVGHVGDGNFHLLLLLKDDEGEGIELTRAKHVVDQLVQLALSMGGTCSGATSHADAKLYMDSARASLHACHPNHAWQSSWQHLQIHHEGLGELDKAF